MTDFESTLTAKYQALTGYKGDVISAVLHENTAKQDKVIKLQPEAEGTEFPAIIVKIFGDETPYLHEKAALDAVKGDSVAITYLDAEKYDDTYCLFLPDKGDNFTTFRPMEPEVSTEGELTEAQVGEMKSAYKQSKLQFFIDDIKSLFKPFVDFFKRSVDRNIVHGDVKPGNALYEEDQDGGLTVTIIDFESSCRKIGDQLQSFDGTPHDVTKSVSAPQYRAPERIVPSFASDVWAAGLVGLNLLIGEHFIKLASEDEIKAQQESELRPYQIEKGRSVVDAATGFLDHIAPRIAKNLNADVKDEASYIPITKNDIISHSGFLQFITAIIPMLQIDPEKRTTAAKASESEFFKQASSEETTLAVSLKSPAVSAN